MRFLSSFPSKVDIAVENGPRAASDAEESTRNITNNNHRMRISTHSSQEYQAPDANKEIRNCLLKKSGRI